MTVKYSDTASYFTLIQDLIASKHELIMASKF